jgi:PAS domain S-box-containing protein
MIQVLKIKQELEESKKREALLASLLENSSQPFGVGYPDGRLGLVNNAFEKLTGYSREELKSTDWSQILTPHKFRDMENEILEELQRTGQPVRYEKEYIRKDGTRVPIELLVHIVKNENGTPDYYYSFITDISERKKIEERLKESELKYHGLFENLPLTTNLMRYVLNDEGKVVDWVFEDMNSMTQELIGYSKEQLKGKSLMELMGRNHIASFLPVVNEIRRTGKVTTKESHLEAMDMYHITTFAPLSNELFLTIDQDITEHKKAEYTLRESEEKYRNIIETANEGIIIADPSGMITYVNAKIAEILGYSSEELIGTDVISLVDQDEVEFGHQKVENRTKGIQESYEIKCRRKNGTELWFLVNATPMFDNNGKHIGNMTMQTDITERKNVEYHNQKLLENEQQLTEELQSSNEELQSTTEELYKSNEELQKSSKLLSTIYELNPDAIVLTTVSDSKIIDCNQEYLNQIGYSREEVIGHTSQELNLISEVTRDAYIDKTRGNKKVSNIEVLGRRKDGSFIDVAYSTRQITVNNVPMILNIGHDLTEQKKTEKPTQKLLEREQQLTEELTVSNKELQSATKEIQITNEELRYQGDELLIVNQRIGEVLGSIKDSFYMLDRDWNFIYMNKPAAASVKNEPKELIGQNIWKIFPNYKGTIIEKNYRESMKNKETIRFESYGQYTDSWYSLTINPTAEGITVLSTDITERKKAELEIKKSEEKFFKAFNSNPAPMSLSDGYRWIDVNVSYLKLTGYSKEELIGHTPDELNFIDAKKRKQYITKSERQGSIHDTELTIRTKSGEKRIVNSNTETIELDSEIRFINFIKDITERKEREEEMKETMDELRRSNDELERFAYVSSHDLQEPIRMVKLYSQLLERRYKDKLDSDADDFIEYIVEGANRMKQLIDDLLEYSRVNSQAKEFENVDLEKVLNNVLRNLSISIKEYNVKLSHNPLPTIFADQNQMLQVLQNLITNAIKFHGQKQPEINISVQKGEKDWIFSVSDNGIGIESKHQKQIFEVFKRLHHNREEYPGSGIGLSITQKIIIHHGGQIWVESEPGKGSTFYFTIPMKLKVESSGEN